MGSSSSKSKEKKMTEMFGLTPKKYKKTWIVPTARDIIENFIRKDPASIVVSYLSQYNPEINEELKLCRTPKVETLTEGLRTGTVEILEFSESVYNSDQDLKIRWFYPLLEVGEYTIYGAEIRKELSGLIIKFKDKCRFLLGFDYLGGVPGNGIILVEYWIMNKEYPYLTWENVYCYDIHLNVFFQTDTNKMFTIEDIFNRRTNSPSLEIKF